MEQQEASKCLPSFKKCANDKCDNFVIDTNISNLYCSQNCLFTEARNKVRASKEIKQEESKILKDMSKVGDGIDILKTVAQIGTTALFQIATLEVETAEGRIIKQLAVLAYNEIVKITK